MAPREFYHSDDYVVITVDIEDCPVVEFPLTELFDIATSTVVDNYLEVVQDYVTQLLEDTTWLDTQSRSCLLRARFCMYHRRNEGELLTLRQPALQRLIAQMLRCRNGIQSCHSIEVPLFIRFKRPAITFPRNTRAAPRVGRSIAMIRSAEAHGFDSARITTIPDVVCSSTTKVSTLTEITPDSFAARFADYGHDCTEKDTLEECYNTAEAPFVCIEDMDYNTTPQMTLLECHIVEGQLLTFDMAQHTAVPTSCPSLVECQNGVMIVSATSTMTDMGTLSCRVATSSVPSWADASCQDAIEDSNRLLPSIDMRFHPIDRGRVRICTS
jgi:hypothetical protein